MDIERLKELKDYLRVANELSILNDDNLMQRNVESNDVTNTIDIAIELLNAELARQSVTDEAVQWAIDWLEAEKESAQNDWEGSDVDWRMEPGSKEMHEERMASFDMAIQALRQMKPDLYPKAGLDPDADDCGNGYSRGYADGLQARQMKPSK